LLASLLAVPAARPESAGEARVRGIVERLAADEMKGRGPGSAELEACGEYIRSSFAAAGLEAGYLGEWFQSFSGPNGEKLRNVVGRLAGSGEEWIVVGAHYDALGVAAKGSEFEGEILNGADDNASGVAALVRIAERLSGEEDFERSVLFVAFSAEESGALGSKAFVEAPPFPLEKAVAMLNLDTIGRIENEQLIIFGEGTAEEFGDLLKGVNFAFHFNIATQAEGPGASDHTPFFAKGIPVLHFFSGAKPEIHRPGDDVDLLNWAGIERIGEFVAECTSYLAAERARLTFRPVGVERLSDTSTLAAPRRKVSFGSIPDFSRESGGILLSGVMPKGPAEEAGLREGDLLIELDGTTIDTIHDFQAVLAAHAPGDTVSVKYVREGGTREAKVMLRERK
jgi:hypothetical protein